MSPNTYLIGTLVNRISHLASLNESTLHILELSCLPGAFVLTHYKDYIRSSELDSKLQTDQSESERYVEFIRPVESDQWNDLLVQPVKPLAYHWLSFQLTTMFSYSSQW